MSTRRKVGEERLYYSPPAMRRHHQMLQQQQQQQPPPPQQQQQQQSKLKSSSSSVPERRGFGSGSYLDRFLDNTTPAVAAQHFPRTSMKSWRNRGSEFHPYFVLGDLWESFREWSVYGVGVPLLWNGTGSVVQYYVPSLSGIQLYIDPTTQFSDQRKPGEESDANSSRETSSDGGSEYGTDRGAHNTRASRSQKNRHGDDISIPPGTAEGANDAGNKLSLPTFGLVSYKFKVPDLNGTGVYEGQKVNSLLRAADNWLRLLQVNHPDYNFMTHNTQWR
ncbi:hypothetical protein MIMGU_mgv1a011632mg [Erythranthe guttata]|uniref:DUF789 domain-containing protein n=1 Tax=Erythranthe guttata TaxID=4155 RepID=A0A022RU11_ERYGU|nr:hypothetical protein MIMGU_mgv1a011632mg [Erythranthe guttata]